MVLFVLGLPGRFAEWCDELTARLSRRALGSTAIVRANTLQEITLGMIGGGFSQAIVAARQPSGRLCAALVEAGRRFIIATDDVQIACAELAGEELAELPAAVQAIASSCAALIGHLAAPGGLVIAADRDGFDGVATAVAVARHFEFNLGEDDISEIVRDMEAGGFAERKRDGQWWDNLPRAAREMALGAIGPYLGDAPDGHPPPITWTRDLFFLGDRPNERPTGPIDITGRARCLIQGPHIILPPGSWSLSLTLLFSREGAEHEFLVEICADHPLASGSIRPQQEGSAAIDLDFALDDSTEQPISIRVSTVRAAFDGTIAMVGASLARAAASADPSPAQLLLPDP
jgi:hypothetical protein